MRESLKAWGAGGGAVAAAFASLLCCAGPLVAVTVGLSGAGLAATFTPLRPWFLGVTAAMLLLGFWLLDREEKLACEPDKPCASPEVRRTMRRVLWLATVVSVVFATFPRWQTLFF